METLKLKGRAEIKYFDGNGNLVDTFNFDNLVVNNGLGYIIDRIQSNSPATASILKIGTGTNAASAGDTDLQTALATVNGTNSQPSATTSRTVATFTGVTGTVTEYGLFADSTLIGRIVSGSREMISADSAQVTYDLSVSV
jgi:hypothetical protein